MKNLLYIICMAILLPVSQHVYAAGFDPGRISDYVESNNSSYADIKVITNQSISSGITVSWQQFINGGWQNISSTSRPNSIYRVTLISQIGKYVQIRKKISAASGVACTNTCLVVIKPFVNADQCNTENFIKQTIHNYAQSASSTTDKSISDITYYNGLGHPKQIINIGASSTGNSVVTPIVYDKMQRSDSVTYSPYTLSSNSAIFRNNAISEQQAFFSDYYGDTQEGSNAKRTRKYERSAQYRPMEAYNSGTGMQNNPVKYKYYTNVGTDVFILKANTAGEVYCRGKYPAAEILAEGIVNEDGVETRIYTDLLGNKIKESVINTESGNIDTYYVYDSFGRLSIVISPEGSASLCDGFWCNDSFIDKYCYHYKYDGRGRVSTKKIPGKEKEYFIYDRAGRVVMSQDGNMRPENRWLLNKYDKKGRLIMQRSAIIGGDTPWLYTYPMLQGFFYGNAQTNIDDIYKQGTLWAEFRYDNTTSIPTGLEFSPVSGVVAASNVSSNVRGAKVYEKIIILNGNEFNQQSSSHIPDIGNIGGSIGSIGSIGNGGSIVGGISGGSSSNNIATFTPFNSNYINRAFYYDNKGRVIQIVEKNHLGGISRLSFKYDYVNNIVLQHESHQKASGDTADTFTKKFSYDNRGRLTEEVAELNGTVILGNNALSDWSKVSCIRFNYNELGQLSSKNYIKKGPLSNTTLLTEDYTYNPQGWLSEQDSELFNMKLRYYNPELYPGLQKKYTGNITEWEWKNKEGHGMGNSPCYTYAFMYDKMNRLTESHLHSNIMGVGNWDDRYTEGGITYDRNSNILTLNRRFDAFDVDILEYSYTGNKLMGLYERSDISWYNPDPDRFYITDMDNLSTYSYDANGNMTGSSYCNLKLEYNSLNLVNKVKTGASQQSDYRWLFDGTKAGVKSRDGEGGFEYLGSLVYKREDGALSLESAGFSGGRIFRKHISGATISTPYYYVTDHLGSVRLVFDSSRNVLQVNNYYPFGLRWADVTSVASDNRYLYNGKEFQITSWMINLHDYGARMYDPVIGRWHSVDPLAEKYYSFSPYNFTLNNPISYIDPNGMDVYRFDKKAGKMVLHQKTDDDYDQVGKFKKNAGTYTLKTRKDGTTKTWMDNIEKGILSDGVNFKTDSHVFDVGSGEGQVSIEGFQDFAVQFGDMVGVEMSGYYYSNKGSSDANYIYMHKYESNKYDYSEKNTHGIFGVRPNLWHKIKGHTSWHTHPENHPGRLEISENDRKAKASDFSYGFNYSLMLTKGQPPKFY